MRDVSDEASISGLAGVLVWTDAERFPAMRDFYVHTLGLQPRSDRTHFVNFEWGTTRLTISVHREVSGPTREPLRLMLNLTVPDIAAAHARLAAAGVDFSRAPEQEPWGGWIATFADPDGNALQLFQLSAENGRAHGAER
ncbi:MAG: VOC family protein [Chloroflexi bacterium]|nr:VOC family protein [Chloroflexota bacterium]